MNILITINPATPSKISLIGIPAIVVGNDKLVARLFIPLVKDPVESVALVETLFALLVSTACVLTGIGCDFDFLESYS